MKFKRGGSRGGHGHGGRRNAGSKDQNKRDAKERSHYKAFGDAHPINDIEYLLTIPTPN